jgi:hypothetical protein
LWERKYIHYGWPGVPGHLRGYRKNIKKADFREQSGVYVLYDKDMIPVYVGQAGKGRANLFSRLKQHDSDHLWNRWVYFSWFGLCKVNKDGSLSRSSNPDRIVGGSITNALNDIEGVVIHALEPKLNKQGPKWKDVQEYFQYIGDEVEESSIDDVIEKQEELESRLASIEKLLKKIS